MSGGSVLQAGIGVGGTADSQAGNIEVDAQSAVNLKDGSQIFNIVRSGAMGKSGDVKITTGSLSLTDGAVVNTSTYGQGNAGNVTITARDAVSFDGIGSNRSPSGAFSTVEQGAVGQGNDVRLATNSLAITNGALVSVAALGQGVAGNVAVKARTLFLDRGTINAITASTDGGNIALQVGDLLLLRHGSLISTTAGTAQGGGNGGNITIDAPPIVAVPKEDSDISANAFKGRGGNIQISTQGIFGLQFRPQDTPLSDITASSQFGVNGTVQITTPGIDPSRGLTDLPTAPADASRQIAQGCYSGNAVASQQNKFVITGRGGLPPNPQEALSNDAVDVSWVTLDPQSAKGANAATPVNLDRTPPTPTIAEVQGWVYGPHGEVILTAAAPSRSLPEIQDCKGLPVLSPKQTAVRRSRTLAYSQFPTKT